VEGGTSAELGVPLRADYRASQRHQYRMSAPSHEARGTRRGNARSRGRARARVRPEPTRHSLATSSFLGSTMPVCAAISSCASRRSFAVTGLRDGGGHPRARRSPSSAYRREEAPNAVLAHAWLAHSTDGPPLALASLRSSLARGDRLHLVSSAAHGRSATVVCGSHAPTALGLRP